MIRLLHLILLFPLAAAAQTREALPDLPTCLDIYVDRYEWMLEVNRDVPLDDVEGGIWFADEVAYCGTLGIVRCDRTGDPAPCQRALAEEALALAAQVRDTLPSPNPGDTWPERLYASTHALANGISAGEDCAGAPELFTAWCLANEGAGRLRDAVLAWQVARYLGTAPPATELGWASPPPPLRPEPRPE